MFYESTRGQAKRSAFEEVLLRGLASDGGLYLPGSWPCIGKGELQRWRSYDYASLASQIISLFIPAQERIRASLSSVVEHAYSDLNFPGGVAKINPISEKLSILELFQGPTFAFKDVALQLLAPLMDDVLGIHDNWATVVGSTSGDTGGAAIEAFKGKTHLNIFILYPHQKVSEIQRRQMTTAASDNVFPLPVSGTFDDCQRILKELFSDDNFRREIRLTAINSINWGRIVAQIVYYFYGYFRMTENKSDPLDVCVPTGNFGNIFAGFIAKQMGLPLRQLVIASNRNDVLPRTLASGKYEVRDVVQTYAPSMDIQVASNLERLIYCCSGRDGDYTRQIMQELQAVRHAELKPSVLHEIKEHFVGYSISDAEILDAISILYKTKEVLIDPHTACGYVAAFRFHQEFGKEVPMMVVGTAHPAKFREIYENTAIKVSLPRRLQHVLEVDEVHYDRLLQGGTPQVKQFILERVRHRMNLAA